MHYKIFIGIDVSKSHIDIFMYGINQHIRCSNDGPGFKKMMAWIIKTGKCQASQVLIVFEHTGLYSLPLSLFLDQQECTFSIIPGLELKRSMGISRGKDDKSDARRLAEYAYEKRDRLKPYQMPSSLLRSLKKLASHRERLVANRAAYKGKLKEYNSFLDENQNALLISSLDRMVGHLTQEILLVEGEMERLIKEDEELLKQYQCINSIKCVGPQTAVMMIILTQGFTQFPEWRNFASYAGIAPFPNESGKFKGKTKVNHLANKRIKTLLSNCATSAIQYNPEMKIYYQRRLLEGKNEMSTLNIVRNKLLARIFAVVKRQTPYAETHQYAA